MKERLTGAIILVALIVLLVPELLSGPKGRSAPAPASAAATSSEEPPLRSYTINLGDDSRSRTAAGSSGPATPQPNGVEQPATPSASAQTDGAKTNGSPVAGSPASSSQPPTSQIPSSPAQAPGAHGSPQSAAPQVGGVRGASQSGTTTVAQTAPSRPAPPATAPRTPPPATAPARVAANHSTNSSASNRPALSNAPRVANAAPAAPPKVTNAPQKSESGWAVQLGVFRSRENAERLATNVRTKGFKVSVSPVTVGREKRYKVRVGPALDRTAAQELQGRLKAAGHPDGTVVPIT